MEKIKVIFLDQREIIRQFIISLFKDDPRIEVLIQFDRIANWPNLIEAIRPDVVIVDVGYTGTAVINKIKQKNKKQVILAISDFPCESEFLDVFKAGVKNYLKTDILTVDNLRASIEFARKEIAVLSDPFSEIFLKFLKDKDTQILEDIKLSFSYPDQSSRLTDQEKAIIAMIMLGASNSQISSFLRITLNTTKVHLRNIMKKLGVKGKQKIAFFIRTHHHLRNELLVDYNYLRDKIELKNGE